MNSFSFKDYQLYYSIRGKGQPLLFLHGFLEDQSMWGDILAEFDEQKFQLITIDLPCHGKSRFGGEICSMTEMAEGVDALFAHLEIEELSCIGHSMGGYVALELSHLRKLNIILLHSNFWADSESKKEDRNRVIDVVMKNRTFFVKEAIPNLFAAVNKDKCALEIQQIVERALLIPKNEIIAATGGMRDRNRFNTLPINSTLSLIHGDLDPIISSAQLDNELSLLDFNPKVIRIKAVGHMSIWESKPALIKAIKSLLIQ